MRHKDVSITYGNLIDDENTVAAALKAAKVAYSSPVAVLLENRPMMITSLLGIMRAGAVYLPLDVSLPWGRISTIVNDCRPEIMIVDEITKSYVGMISRAAIKIIDVSELKRKQMPTINSAKKDAPAVILYTSGSTGTPKGIVLKHDGLRNWIEPAMDVFGLEREVVLQQTSPAFDLSLIQIFVTLCFGGTLVLASRQDRGDAKAIGKIIRDYGVTFTCATPSEYSAWLNFGGRELLCCKAWKAAICAGEPVHGKLLEQFSVLAKKDLQVYNAYGPTETTLTCTVARLPLHLRQSNIAAGRPLPNYSVYVLDSRQRPVPVRVQGEICIGGPGVCLGYLNQPHTTASRFLPNLIEARSESDGSLKILHRTGHLGRWLDDGQLNVEGRLDNQIKLRGLRIDLAEIEHALVDACDGEVSEAIVSVRKD